MFVAPQIPKRREVQFFFQLWERKKDIWWLRLFSIDNIVLHSYQLCLMGNWPWCSDLLLISTFLANQVNRALVTNPVGPLHRHRGLPVTFIKFHLLVLHLPSALEEIGMSYKGRVKRQDSMSNALLRNGTSQVSQPSAVALGCSFAALLDLFPPLPLSSVWPQVALFHGRRRRGLDEK